MSDTIEKNELKEKMKNIFENAKFGDRFQTRDGRMAIYWQKLELDGEHRLICQDLKSSIIVKDDGHYQDSKELGIDIVSEWQDNN